ncbi:MAG: DUF4429 domain-containing protein [Acidobacteria bacterium]|nr:DUF4429 domain-containing protein [Acidobacteriota bacterium]
MADSSNFCSACGRQIAAAPNAFGLHREEPATVTATSHAGQIIFDGAAVTILRKGRRGGFTVGKGEKVIPISSISAIDWKPAGAVIVGFIGFTIAGALENRERFGGRSMGAVKDQNSVVFAKRHESDFETLRQAIQKAVNTRRG